MELRGAIFTLLLASATAFGVAHADSPAPDAVAVPIPGSDPPPKAMTGSARLVSILQTKSGAPTLVGQSGELYKPGQDLHWQRDSAGGVSADVLALYRNGSEGLFAVGSRAPLFRRKAGVWSAFHMGNRGRAAVSPGQQDIISIGRHIYQLSGTNWQRVASAKGRIRALYSPHKKQIYVATTRDQLYVGRNGWRKIPIKLVAGDKIRAIAGVPGKATVALTVQNRLYLLGKKGAKLISLGAKFRGLEVHTMGVAKGKLLLAGRLVAGASERTLLLELAKGKLKDIGPLWPLEAEDRFALLYEDGQKRLLVASHRGQVRLRDETGRWRNGVVVLAPPAPPEDFTKSAPALSK